MDAPAAVPVIAVESMPLPVAETSTAPSDPAGSEPTRMVADARLAAPPSKPGPAAKRPPPSAPRAHTATEAHLPVHRVAMPASSETDRSRSRRAPIRTDPVAADAKPARTAAPTRAADAFPAPGPAFAVHITSYRSLSGARKDWKRLVRRHPEQLFGLRARASIIDLGPPRGRFYRLKAGPLPTRKFADKLCGSLRRKGLYCAVRKFTGTPVG